MTPGVSGDSSSIESWKPVFKGFDSIRGIDVGHLSNFKKMIFIGDDLFCRMMRAIFNYSIINNTTTHKWYRQPHLFVPSNEVEKEIEHKEVYLVKSSDLLKTQFKLPGSDKMVNYFGLMRYAKENIDQFPQVNSEDILTLSSVRRKLTQVEQCLKDTNNDNIIGTIADFSSLELLLKKAGLIENSDLDVKATGLNPEKHGPESELVIIDKQKYRDAILKKMKELPYKLNEIPDSPSKIFIEELIKMKYPGRSI
jgi:hypothetical protein